MFLIRSRQQLSPDVTLLVIDAPRVAKNRKAGQFCIVRVGKTGERIPLTIADMDSRSGTITLIIQAVGATTHRLCALKVGDAIDDVVGPLGRPTEIERFGHVVVVGGGVGTAVIFPQAAALKDAGNRVTAIMGGRTKPYVILEEPLRDTCDEVFPCTDDGSYGYHGFVTGKLKEVIDRASPPVDAIFAAGPVPMMRAVAELTRPYGIYTVVSLNPIMVDGTGMCGGCRVNIDGRMRFACVDGPEFDAHQVDFAELADRLTAYRPQEKKVFEREMARQCKLDEQLAALQT